MQFPADLVTFTQEILNEKLHFLCSAMTQIPPPHTQRNIYTHSQIHRRKHTTQENKIMIQKQMKLQNG